MKHAVRLLLSVLVAGLSVHALDAQTPFEEVRAGLRQLAIDPAQTYRVRDVQFARGGVKIYLTEGVLAFAKPIRGRSIAAVFTTQPVDAGDAEILTFAPNRAERSSLAGFTGSPNLDEHFTSALLFFGDDTAHQLLAQILERPVHPAAEVISSLEKVGNTALQSNAGQIDVRLTAALLDQHPVEQGFFYAMIGSRDKGAFDFAYQPDQPDAVTFGRLMEKGKGLSSYFQIWSAFSPRNAVEAVPPLNMVNDYRIEASVRPDLSLAAEAQFDYVARPTDGTVITLLLSSHLQVRNATVDGQPAEICQHATPLSSSGGGATGFLLVTKIPLAAGSHHKLQVKYEGVLIHKTERGTYFVDDRSAWYPYVSPLRARFDLIFHCPESLQMVTTGEPVEEIVAAGIRTVHRRTTAATALAGFNIGEYAVKLSKAGPYRIAVYANRSSPASAAIPSQTADILEKYTALWGPLPFQSLAISPIEGYFGQGFSGLIYLSDISYILEQDRPAALRNPRLDSFFSEMLLPHEIAHQWWGNLVAPADYRSNWILEGMSNYVALQYLERSKGRSVADDLLAGYRNGLLALKEGKPIDNSGPVVFGERLLDNYGNGVWHDIVYEKGAWIFHMLRQRLGDAGFSELQRRLLRDFSSRPITNEDLRKVAAQFMPPNAPDHLLTGFFETWVYGTGIPTLSLTNRELAISGVDEDYAVDVPLSCAGAGVKKITNVIHVTSGASVIVLRGCGLPLHNEFLYR